MGGIETNGQCETRIKGLFAVGECASVGLHGANRLGSNSLAEFVVFGRVAGEHAAERAKAFKGWNEDNIKRQISDVEARIQALLDNDGTESWSDIRTEMGHTMEAGCGIYRKEDLMQTTIDKLTELKARYKKVGIKDKGKVFNTDLLYAIEVGYGLEVAEAMAQSAIRRKESRGAHQRLDEGCTTRDDENFLKHTLSFYQEDAAPVIDYSSVKITKSQPKARLYGAAADEAAAKEAAEQQAQEK